MLSAGFLQGTSYPVFQLFAGSSVAAPSNATLVTQSEVQALVPEAISAWQAAGLDAADVRKLESVPVQVSNLGTTILGLEANDVITINQTAAGYNWYDSAGSGSSQAFDPAGSNGESFAQPNSPADDDVDLLTELEHELGHVLGLPDNAEAGDLMDITLGLGVRRLPSSADLAAIVSSTNTVGVVNIGGSTGSPTTQVVPIDRTGDASDSGRRSCVDPDPVRAKRQQERNDQNTAAINDSAGQVRGTNARIQKSHPRAEKTDGRALSSKYASGAWLARFRSRLINAGDPKRSSRVSRTIPGIAALALAQATKLVAIVAEPRASRV